MYNIYVPVHVKLPKYVKGNFYKMIDVVQRLYNTLYSWDCAFNNTLNRLKILDGRKAKGLPLFP